MAGSIFLIGALGAIAAIDLQAIPPALLVAAGVLLVLLLLLLAAFIRVVLGARAIHRASTEGRRISAEQSGPHPLTNFTRDGLPSDPLNVKINSTAGQLAVAFLSAGWYRADETDFITSLRIIFDAIFKRKYPTAPMSNLYLYGRRQDYAFERPGSSVRQRDHVRFWDTGQRSRDGRAVWVGGATKDIAVELSRTTFLPTHKIAPDVDDERAVVVRDLTRTGWVVEEDWEPGFGKPTESKNGGGDPYHTDGQVAVLDLANVPVLTPLATNLRGALGGQVGRTVATATRWRLPKRGRERAKRLRTEPAREPATAPVTRSKQD